MFGVFAITLRKIVNFSLKAKELNSVRVRPFILSVFIFLCFQVCHAQVEPTVKPPQGDIPAKADTTNRMPADTIPPGVADTLRTDSLRADSLNAKIPKGDIETTINYSARDSIRASMDSQMVWLYGEARSPYGEIELDADEIA